MTLPLIYALSKSSWLEKRRIISIIRNDSEKVSKVKEVIDYVRASGGIEYAKQVMEKYYQQALEMLSDFPESNYKTSLGNLVRFTIERSK